jgi:hypothetical protein
MPTQLGRQESEIMSFLHGRISDPILHSPEASENLCRCVSTPAKNGASIAGLGRSH